MKAIRIEKFGDVKNLRPVDLPEPVPGADEVIVRVRAAAINPSDVKNAEGKMPNTILPRVPGRDFAGTIAAGPVSYIGMDVWGTGGDIGFTRDGTHAERIAIPVEAVIPKPSNLSFEEAAAAGLPFLTAHEGVVQRAKLSAGETLLVTGAQGAVGSAAMQLAAALGCRIISVGRRPVDEATAGMAGFLGHVNTSEEDLVEAVRRITDGKGVDVVFDAVGGPIFEPALQTLSMEGRYAVITSAGERRVSFDLLDFYHHRLTLLGVDSMALGVIQSSKRLKEMSPLFESGRLHPSPVARRGTLAQAAELYEQVGLGKAGKCVFVFD